MTRHALTFAVLLSLSVALGALCAACGWKSGLMIDPQGTVCVEVDVPTTIEVATSAEISSADVLFLVDQTGSMHEEIAAIRASVTSRLIPGIQRQIPDARFGVAAFGDLPLVPYGGPLESAFVSVAPMTDDPDQIVTGIDSLAALDVSGGDLPEAQVLAMHLVATGEGFGTFVEPPDCPPDTIGYPCFRMSGARIIMLFTDAAFHNGPDGSNTYGFIAGPPPPSYAQVVGELDAIGARVVGLFSGDVERGLDADLRAIARDTGAVNARGEPLVFDIGTEGERLGDSVIDAVRDLSSDALLEVDAIVADAPGDDVDATRFVRRVRPARAVPGSGGRIEGDHFVDVLPGTHLFFALDLENDFVTPTDVPQSFPVRVIFRDRGVPALGEVTVLIVIPAVTGEGCGLPAED